jgi:hypothetical protein
MDYDSEHQDSQEQVGVEPSHSFNIRNKLKGVGEENHDSNGDEEEAVVQKTIQKQKQIYLSDGDDDEDMDSGQPLNPEQATDQEI